MAEACKEEEKDKFPKKEKHKSVMKEGKWGAERTEKALTPVTIASPWHRLGTQSAKATGRGMAS